MASKMESLVAAAKRNAPSASQNAVQTGQQSIQKIDPELRKQVQRNYMLNNPQRIQNAVQRIENPYLAVYNTLNSGAHQTVQQMNAADAGMKALRRNTQALQKMQSLLGDQTPVGLTDAIGQAQTGYAAMLGDWKDLRDSWRPETYEQRQLRLRQEAADRRQAQFEQYQQDERERLRSIDYDDTQTEIERLQGVRNTAQAILTVGSASGLTYGGLLSGGLQSPMEQMQDYLESEGFSNVADIDAKISELMKDAQAARGLNMTADAQEADDFAYYSAQGMQPETETHEERVSRLTEALRAANNNPNPVGARAVIKANGYDSKEDLERALQAEYMTEDEAAVYAYYRAKYGDEKAAEYVDAIADELNLRAAQEEARGFAGTGAKNRIRQIGAGVSQGFDQFKSGMEGFGRQLTGSAEAQPTSKAAYLGMLAREELGSLRLRDDENITNDNGFSVSRQRQGTSIGQVAFDLTSTTANMLPSILASTAANAILPGSGEIVGAGLMGASAGGNAYDEMIRLGYAPAQASAYAKLTGASEAGLQYLLGGITQLGGKLTGSITNKILMNVDNALAITAIKLGQEFVSEGTEEYLQDVLEPIFRNIAFGENNEVRLFSKEALYSGVLGGVSALLMSGGGTVSETLAERRIGLDLVRHDINAQRIAEIGRTFPVDSDVARLASRISNDSGAFAIGRLFNEIGTSLSEQNISDIESGLIAKGVTERDASEIAREFALAVESPDALTESQQRVLEKTSVATDTIREVLLNDNLQRRNEGVRSIQADLRTRVEDIVRENMEAATVEERVDEPTLERQQQRVREVMAETDDRTFIDGFNQLRQEITQEHRQNLINGSAAEANATERVMNVLDDAFAAAEEISDTSTKAATIRAAINESLGGMNNGEAGSAVSYDGSGRIAGERAGVEAGAVRSDAYRGDGTVEGSGQANDVVADGEVWRSAAELNIPDGTDNKNIREKMDLTDGEEEKQKIARALGYNLRYVNGAIEVRNRRSGSVQHMTGVAYGGEIVVQADSGLYTSEQLAEHEITHARVAQDPALLMDVMRQLVQEHDYMELDAIIRRYAAMYNYIYGDESPSMTSDERDALYMKYFEEVVADAAAGISRVSIPGRGAASYADTVQRIMRERGSQGNSAAEVNETRYSETEANRHAETETKEGLRLPTENDLIAREGRITPDMTDAQRAEAINNKTVTIPTYDSTDAVTEKDINALRSKYQKDAKILLKELGEKCGVFEANLYNQDVDLRFEYSRKSQGESLDKQADRHGSYMDFGKMLTILPEICEGAAEVEAHTDKYVDTRREDPNLKEMHVLLGAFHDGDRLVPVQLEIKEFKPGTPFENKLYVTVTLNSNEAGIYPRNDQTHEMGLGSLGTPASYVSVADIIGIVNDKTGGLVKYFPDSMLSEEQITRKRDALERDERRLNDMRYEYAVEQGNTERANQLLEQRAEEQGYTRDGEIWRKNESVKQSGPTVDDKGNLIPLSQRFDENNLDVRFSYGGEKARTANIGNLENAESMERAGRDSETIRRETGWFRGMDGKWRFEISDADMVLHMKGDAQFRTDHPAYARYQTLMEQMLYGDLTSAEETELRQMDDIWGREFSRLSDIVENGRATLGMILDHPALFAAYPQLRDVRVRFMEMDSGERGSYDPMTGTIDISNEMKGSPARVLDTLAHEVQHCVQAIEGFKGGASTDYWSGEKSERVADAEFHVGELEERLKNQQDFVSMLERNGWDKDSSLYQKGIEDLQDLREKYNKATQALNNLKGSTSYELYDRTAGEIEARDVTARRNMTDAERRNTRPNIDRDDVVFAEDAGASYEQEEKHVKKQIRDALDDLNSMQPVTYIQDALDMGNNHSEWLAWLTDKLAYTGYQVERIDRGTIRFPKSRLSRALKLANGKTERAALLAVPAVLEKGKIIYARENHKSRQYESFTIGAPVVINGQLGVMGAVVKRTSDNFLYAARIMTPDGHLLVLEKDVDAEPTSAGALSETDTHATPISSASDNSISEAATESNTQNAGAEEEIHGLRLPTVEDTEPVYSASDEVENGDETGYTGETSPELQRAIEMVRAGAALSEIYNETGYVRMGNGLQNMETGQIEWRDTDAAESGLRKEYAQKQARGTAEAEVSGDDGRRVREESGGDVQRLSFDDLSEFQKQRATRIINEFADTHSNSEVQLLREYYGDPRKFAEDIYDAYQHGNAVLEYDARYLGDVSELAAALDEEFNPGYSEPAFYSAADTNPDAWEAGETEAAEREEVLTQKAVEAMTPTELRQAIREDRADAKTYERLLNDASVPEDVKAALRQKLKEVNARIEREAPALREINQRERAARKEQQRIAEAKQAPTKTRADFINGAMEIFQTGVDRSEVAAMLGRAFDDARSRGYMTQDQKSQIVDRLIESGVASAVADPYYADIRSNIAGTRIYVPQDVRTNWTREGYEDIRHEAFRQGIILTSNSSDLRIDSLNAEMAEMYPGAFDAGATDMSEMLENIIDMARQGRSEQISLAEMLQRNQDNEGWRVDDQIDDLANRLDQLIDRTMYAAGIEVEQKARTERTLTKEREQRREAIRRQAEARQLREDQQRTLKSLQWLQRNDRKIPAEIKEQIGSEYGINFDEVLSSIDLYAASIANEMRWSEKHQATWRDLADMYAEAKRNDPNFLPSKELEQIWARVNLKKVSELDVDALSDLYKAASALRTEYYNRNNVIGDEEHRLFSEWYGDATADILASAGKGNLGEGLGKLMTAEMMTPMNLLNMMGGWKSGGQFYDAARQLQAGERAKKGYETEAKAMLDQFNKDHADWIRRADGQGKNAIWEEIEVPECLELRMGDKPIFGDTVKVYMTPMQKVQMYLESKNDQNLRHMLGGRTFVNKELYAQGKRTEALAQGTTVRLAPETVKGIVANMTAEEMELAGLLERYYNEYASGEINRVSQILYGYDKAMTQFYAPIFTDSNYNKTTAGIFDVTAEGVGHMKTREQVSKNPSYNISAIDAFERHVGQTSRFVGLAIPIRNVERLMNWTGNGTSMKATISKKWGKEGVDYIQKLLTELQSPTTTEQTVIGKFGSKALSNYITAVFGANPGIMLKQFASFPAAAAVLDGPVPIARMFGKVDEKLIAKYTPELAYRKLGQSMPEIAAMRDNPSWLDRNRFTRFWFRGGGIQAVDTFTVKSLWAWAESTVRKANPELEVGTQEQIDAGTSEFYKAVAEKFNEAVNLTQPMYDTMNRANIMNSDNALTRTFTLFKTVPLQEYNTLRRAFGQAQTEGKTGKRQAARAIGTVLASTVMLEAFEAVNAFVKNGLRHYRDDDDELTAESFARQFGMNMAGDLAGIMIGGSEIFEALGSHFGWNDYSSDFQIVGAEQINEMRDAVTGAATLLETTVAGMIDVASNGGDVGEYLNRNAGDIRGGIKNIATALAKYMGGLPVENIEKYLTGILGQTMPEAAAVYEGWFDTTTKKDLSYIDADELPTRLGDLMTIRGIDIDEGTAEELARLYTAGEHGVVPVDTPTSIRVNGDDVALSPYQRQVYDNSYSSAIGESLDALISSAAYQTADDETRARMLEKLYKYAQENAALAVNSSFDADGWIEQAQAAQRDGLSLDAYIALTSQGLTKTADKMEYLAGMGVSDDEAGKLYYYAIASDSRRDDVDALRDAGMDWATVYDTMSEYLDVDAMEDTSANMKAATFMTWAYENLDAEETAAALENLTFSSGFKASPDGYQRLVDSGLDPDDALALYGGWGALQPEGDSLQVTVDQKLRFVAESTDLTTQEKTAAIGVLLGTNTTTESGGLSQYGKFQAMMQAGLSIDDYMTLREAGAVNRWQWMREDGLGAQTAMTAAIALQNLKPEPGEDSVSTLQKVNAIMDAVPGNDDQITAIKSVLYDTQAQKLDQAVGYGITARTYVDFLNTIQNYYSWDPSGSATSLSQKECTAALQSMNLTNTERAVLWQIQTMGKNGKNNPFSTSIGKEVYDTYQAWSEQEKEEAEAEKQQKIAEAQSNVIPGLNLPTVEQNSNVQGLALPTYERNGSRASTSGAQQTTGIPGLQLPTIEESAEGGENSWLKLPSY